MDRETIEKIITEIIEIEEKYKEEEEEDFKILKLKDQYNQKKYDHYKGAFVRPSEQSYQLKGLWIPIEIWKDENLNHAEMRVLVEIINRTVDDRLVFGYEWLSKICNCSIHHIYRIIDALEKKGYISIHPILSLSDNKGYIRYIKFNKFKYLLPIRYKYSPKNIKVSGIKL